MKLNGATPMTHSEAMSNTPIPHTSQPALHPEQPVQLTIEGFDPTAGIDPRFILDDETCRRGLRHIAAIRARLRGDSETQAA